MPHLQAPYELERESDDDKVGQHSKYLDRDPTAQLYLGVSRKMWERCFVRYR